MSPGRIVAAVVALVLLALVAFRRKRLGLERTVLAALAAVALTVYASGVLSRLPDAEQVITDVARLLGPWTYALVGAMAFLETGAFVGLVAPGEFTIILGGVIAGQGEVSVVLLFGLVWLCAFLGDTTSFFIGKRLGRGFLERHGPRVGITAERLERVEGYFDRHGGKTILIGRFIGLVRALAPFVAGSSRMPFARFAPYSIVGTGLWAALFTGLGYVFYRSFSKVAHVAGQATLAFGIVVVTIVGVVHAYRRLRQPAERRRLTEWLDRQGRRPLLRPLAAVLRPLWRHVVAPLVRVTWPRVLFLVRRFMPGDLGIELTASMAVAGVGLFVFVLYASLLARDPNMLTPADGEVLRLARHARGRVGFDLVKAVTELGALYTVAGAVAIASIVVVLRRRWTELVALVVGFIAVVVAVRLAKDGIGRPRPEPQLVPTDGKGFPSGHAAYSTAYVAIALVAAALMPGLARRALIVVVGLLMAAIVGISRLYLQVHYWSDVAGGWALGLGIFAVCAAAALIVAFVRDNPPDRG